MKTKAHGLLYAKSVERKYNKTFGLWGFQLNFMRKNNSKFTIVRGAKY